jgi:hypothetical protein
MNRAIARSSPTFSKESAKSEKLTAVGCRSIGRWLSALQAGDGVRVEGNPPLHRKFKRGEVPLQLRGEVDELGGEAADFESVEERNEGPDQNGGRRRARQRGANENVAEFKRFLTRMTGIDVLPPEPPATSLSVDMAILCILSRQSSR